MGLGASMLVGFFLTPFIMHRLGNVGFGLWVLTTSVTGYYGMLDFGLRSAIVRYVARDVAKEDWDGVSKTVSTTFFLYSLTGSLIILVTLLVSWKFDGVFHVAPEWRHSGVALLLVMGIGTGLTVPVTLFGGILEGIQKFFLVGVVQTGVAIVRALLIVWVLRPGHGLVALGFISVSTNFLGNLIYWTAAHKYCPMLRLHWANIQKTAFRLLMSFGGVTFIISIAQQLRFQTDSIVIGSFLGVQLITVFAIGSKLVSYSTDAVQFMAQVFTPMSSHHEAKGEWGELQRVLIVGNRYSSFVALPLASFLLILGKDFITAWVGPAYVSSYRILVILTVPTTLYLAQAVSTKIMFGMSRHGPLAAVLMAEGAANLILSILLLRWYGVEGVALGTAIPMLCTSFLFLPYYSCKLVKLSVWKYLQRAYTYPLLLCAPFALILWGAERWIHPQDYEGLIKVMCMGGTVYGSLLLLYFHLKERPSSNQDSQYNPAADHARS
jgi:O-antigen/teichoic acid export membrane protein